MDTNEYTDALMVIMQNKINNLQAELIITQAKLSITEKALHDYSVDKKEEPIWRDKQKVKKSNK